MRLDARHPARLALLTVGIVAGSVALTGPASAVAPPDGTVFVNEIHYDNTGADVGEAVEVASPAGTNLAGWSLVLYNGSNGASYDTELLTGVVADQSDGFGTLSFPTVGIQNGAPDAIALVRPDATVEQFLSYEGSLTAVGGPASGLTSTDIGVSEAGTEAAGTSLALTGTGAAYGDFAWQPSGPASFGMVNPGQSFGDAPPPPPPPPPTPCAVPPMITPISTVQGTTDVTPCGGTAVVVEGVVVGDYEGPSPALRGFYVQEQDNQHDADVLTSEGIFVFNGDADSVDLGDVVTVTGTAAEFQGQTQIAIGLTGSVTVDNATGAAVTPTQVSLPLPSEDFLERYEGMLVELPQTLTVTELFQLGRFGEIVVSSGGRLYQPTNVAEPGLEAQALQAANDLNQLKIDDAVNAQNADPLFGRGGDPLTASNTLRGGDTVTGATGVLTYTWAGNSASPNAYRLRVVGDLSDSGLASGGVVPAFAPTNPRPMTAPEVGGSLEVGAFNVLNYFLTLDQGTNLCGPTGFTADCRGAEDAEEFQRQRAKLLEALLELDADVLGIVEVENTTGVEPLADIVAGLNAVAGEGTYDFIETGTVGTDVIKVGLIYQPGSVTPVGAPAVLDKTVDPRFDSDNMRPSLAHSFSEVATGEAFTVVVNHLKSKGCGGATGADADQSDGQGCFNAMRTAAAQALRDWIASRPTGVQDDDVLVVGDLNSYAKEDPIDVLVEAGFVDLAASLIGPESYSYVFDGQWGYLDYVLASPSLTPQVTGAAEYHINADEPSVLDYNTNFKSPEQVDSLYAPDEFRTSDHDPVLVGLALDGLPGAQAAVFPKSIREANGAYRLAVVFGYNANGFVDTSIVSVTSSEPDCGEGFGTKCNDIRQSGNQLLALRAESFGPERRTYTIVVALTDETQTVYETLTVTVRPVNA